LARPCPVGDLHLLFFASFPGALRSGSKRDKKPCPLSRQLPPKAAMAAGGTANDPRQHARQRRAVARCVVLAVPLPADHERRPMARSRSSAIVRPAHGVHPVRQLVLMHGRTGTTATAREPDRGAMAVGGEPRRSASWPARRSAPSKRSCWRTSSRTRCSTLAGRAGDGGTAGNEGGAGADRGDVADDYRGRAAGD
jgi:hypothetical protein